METFGERLRRIREELEVSVNELGRRTGKDPGGISRIERGERWGGKQPPGDDIQLFADALGIPFEVLRGSVVRETRAPYLSDAALMLRFGAEIVPQEEAEPALEDFTASARHGRGNLLPQNYDEMRRRPKPTGKRKPKPDPTTFKLRVSGDCLTPRFDNEPHTVRDGEIVWFDTLLPREPICLVFAVMDEHEGHIKRLVLRDGAPWLETNDGWSTEVDEHWRLVARAFNAQRRLL